MIVGLTGTAGIMVTGGSSSPYINMSNPSAGMVRYNGNNMEVYDGHVWISMGSHNTIQLDSRAQEVLHWAEQKMQEEANLKRRLDQHPGLKDAYERFKVMDALTLEEEKHQGVYRRA